MIEAAKDITLNEMVATLRAERALEIGRSALSAWLRGRGWTFKKSPRMQWTVVLIGSTPEARSAWRDGVTGLEETKSGDAAHRAGTPGPSTRSRGSAESLRKPTLQRLEQACRVDDGTGEEC